MSDNLKNDMLNAALKSYIPEHRMKLSNEDIIKLMRANSIADVEFPNAEESEKPVGGPMGWICPVCGRGLSPYTSSCPCAINREITCGMGTTPIYGTDKINFKHIANLYEAELKPPIEEKYNG